MARVKYPLLSSDAYGDFAKQIIFTRGGKVRKYFRPGNPKTALQEAHRAWFREKYMAKLSREEADLLYAAIAHLHDGVYSPLGHGHEGEYSPVGHVHKIKILLGAVGEDGVIAAGGTSTLKPFRSGLAAGGFNVAIPIAGRLKNLYFRTGGVQPGTGTMTCTLNVNNILRSVVATVPAGAGVGTFTDLSNYFDISAGDVVWFTIKNNASGNSAPVVSALIELEFDSGAG